VEGRARQRIDVVERIELDGPIVSISATKARRQMFSGDE
jgi:hypothetical protein